MALRARQCLAGRRAGEDHPKALRWLGESSACARARSRVAGLLPVLPALPVQDALLEAVDDAGFDGALLAKQPQGALQIAELKVCVWRAGRAHQQSNGGLTSARSGRQDPHGAPQLITGLAELVQGARLAAAQSYASGDAARQRGRAQRTRALTSPPSPQPGGRARRPPHLTLPTRSIPRAPPRRSRA